MSVFILKLIAMSTMLVDHIAYWFVNNNNVMRNIGRTAFIIYAFLMAESFYHLKDRPERLKSHVIKLAVLSLITEIPYDQFDHAKWVAMSSQNVIITLLIGYTALIVSSWWIRKCRNGALKIHSVMKYPGAAVICFAAACISYLIKSEYAFRGVLLVIMFYLYLQKCDDLPVWQRLLVLLAIDALYCALGLWTRSGFGSWAEFVAVYHRLTKWTVGMVAWIIPLAFYNRKLGYHSRWFGWLYSLYYPMQFIVSVIVRYMIKGY